MTRHRNLWRLLAALFAVSLLAAACGGDDDDSADVDTGTDPTTAPGDDGDAAEPAEDFEISYGIVEPTWIDSFNVQDSEGFEVARLLFDGLTDLNDDLEAIPAVATEWETEDNLTWTFTLRDDVTFHNGEAVTAQSFIDAWNRVADPELASDVAYYGSYITNIEGWADVEAGDAEEITGLAAPDDTTLEITLASPYPLLPKALSHPVFSPVSLDAVEEGGEGYSDAPVGNGPYMMDGSWSHDQSIRVVRYEDYYGEAGGPSAIDFQIYAGIEQMYLDVQAGALDIGDVPPEEIDSARSTFGDAFLEVQIGSYTYLGFPTDQPPFDNPDIRRALSMAIDRDTIAEQIFSGTVTPANGFAPDLAPGAANEFCDACEFDPEAAADLFESAGGIPGDTINIYFNTGGGHEEWIEAVANGWEQHLGITAQLIGQEFAPYLDVLQAGDVDGPYRLGWLWDVPSAENFLTPLFSSQSTDNYSHYNNPDFDAAIEEFKNAETEEDGEPALADAQEILAQDMPVAPMYFSTAHKVHSENVSNVSYTVFGYTPLELVRPAS